MVQVVVCPTFKRREKTPYGGGSARSSSAAPVSLREQLTQQYDETMRSVREFAVQGFDKREKREYESDRTQLLGGKSEKNKKMPYKLMMRLKKDAVKRLDVQNKEKKQADVVEARYVSLAKKAQQQREKLQKKKSSDSGLHATAGGRLKRGVLYVNNKSSSHDSKRRKQDRV